MASSCFGSEVDFALDTLRALRDRLGRGVQGQDRLDVMVDLCEAFDELDEAMKLGADLPAAWCEGRIIRTVEGLDALPTEAVVRDSTGVSFERYGNWTGGLSKWLEMGKDVAADGGDVQFPALLVWHPDWETC